MAIRPNITVICVGKPGRDFLEDGTQNYLKNLKKWSTTNIKYIKPSDEIDRKKKEAIKILAELKKLSGIKVLMEEKGELFTSTELASKLSKYFLTDKNIIFIIGGISGVTKEVKLIVDLQLSLSSLCFNHRLAKVMLLEQLFRVLSIMNNGTYHR